MGSPQRPVLRYHGGKWLLAPWIISHFPKHRIYVEPFGGAASVLLQKPSIPAEIYNDLEDAVVNIFQVLQDPAATKALHRRLFYTTFSRAEFDRTYEPAEDAIDFACKTIVRSFFGFGTDSVTRSCRTGFRAKCCDQRAMPSQAWKAWCAAVPLFVDRLRGVTIERTDAWALIPRYDSPNTLFYLDPPYVTSSRSSLKNGRISTHGYRHEMTDEDHQSLAALLHGVQGFVVLSGYQTPLYKELYAGWVCTERRSLADGARERVECLWLNPSAAAMLPRLDFAECAA